MKLHLRLIVLLVAVPLVLAGTAGMSSATASPRVTAFPGTINLAFPAATATQFFPLYLAKDDGIFTKFGLNVNVEVVGAAVLDPALESGAIQITVTAPPGNEFAYQEGVPIKLIGMYGEHTNALLVASPGISKISDLTGKPVGISAPTANSSILLKYALHIGGVPLNSVRYVTIAGGNGTPGFIAGQFDAFTNNVAQLRIAQAGLPGTSAIYSFIHLLWPSEIWGYTPWMATHKAETAAVLRALNAAVVTWDTNPTLADHEISIYSATSVESTITAAYSGTKQIFNNGPIAVHVPSTRDEAFVNKVLRLTGFPTAYNSYADEGQEWTPTYWNAAFGKK